MNISAAVMCHLPHLAPICPPSLHRRSGESARTQTYVVRVYFLRGIDLIPPPSTGVYRSINPYLIVSLGSQQLRYARWMA